MYAYMHCYALIMQCTYMYNLYIVIKKFFLAMSVFPSRGNPPSPLPPSLQGGGTYWVVPTLIIGKPDAYFRAEKAGLDVIK